MDTFFIHSFGCSLLSLYFLSLKSSTKNTLKASYLWSSSSSSLLVVNTWIPSFKTHHVHHIHRPLKVYGRTPSYGGSTHSNLLSVKSKHFIWTHKRSVRPHTPVYGRTHTLNGRTHLCAASHTLLAAHLSRTLNFKAMHSLKCPLLALNLHESLSMDHETLVLSNAEP